MELEKDSNPIMMRINCLIAWEVHLCTGGKEHYMCMCIGMYSMVHPNFSPFFDDLKCKLKMNYNVF